MRVVENVPIASMTTLRLGGPARRVVYAEREVDVLSAVAEADAPGTGRGEPGGGLLVVGGGSNLVVSDEGFPGTVLRIATRGIDATKDGDAVLLTVAAGEVWDELVAHAVSEGLRGVECLAGIPGLVGAVPMQNVGAYGQDVSETIVRVRTWDRREARIAVWDNAACRFAYRSSAFRGSDRYVILDVTFRLERSGESCPVRYAELARALMVTSGERAPLDRVRETVVSLRRKKGMVLDPADHDTASAGSFFTNPILSASDLEALVARVAPTLGPDEKMPTFPEPDGRTKVSAAWLIERAGFTRGHALGPVAISSKHALALTNRGGATTADLLALARAVRDGVRERFGVLLENEPVFVGVRL